MDYQPLDKNYSDYSAEPWEWLQPSTQCEPNLYAAEHKTLPYYTAVHEAAHAVLNEHYGYTVTTVQIRTWPPVTQASSPNGIDHAHNFVILHAAYVASLQVINKRAAFDLASDDGVALNHVCTLARFDLQRIKELYATCLELVEQSWKQIEAVANVLADKGTLSGDGVRAIIRSVG